MRPRTDGNSDLGSVAGRCRLRDGARNGSADRCPLAIPGQARRGLVSGGADQLGSLGGGVRDGTADRRPGDPASARCRRTGASVRTRGVLRRFRPGVHRPRAARGATGRAGPHAAAGRVARARGDQRQAWTAVGAATDAGSGRRRHRDGVRLPSGGEGRRRSRRRHRRTRQSPAVRYGPQLRTTVSDRGDRRRRERRPANDRAGRLAARTRSHARTERRAVAVSDARRARRLRFRRQRHVRVPPSHAASWRAGGARRPRQSRGDRRRGGADRHDERDRRRGARGRPPDSADDAAVVASRHRLRLPRWGRGDRPLLRCRRRRYDGDAVAAAAVGRRFRGGRRCPIRPSTRRAPSPRP